MTDTKGNSRLVYPIRHFHVENIEEAPDDPALPPEGTEQAEDGAPCFAEEASDMEILVSEQKDLRRKPDGSKERQYIVDDGSKFRYTAVEHVNGDTLRQEFSSRQSALAWLSDLHTLKQQGKIREYCRKLRSLSEKTASLPCSIEAEYQKDYQEARKHRDFSGRSFDWEFMERMMRQGEYSDLRIRMCVQSKSPESVRSPKYALQLMEELTREADFFPAPSRQLSMNPMLA